MRERIVLTANHWLTLAENDVSCYNRYNMKSILAYPRLIALGMCMGAAYVLYEVGMFEWLDGRLHGLGYPGAFAAGLLFSYGFTTPFAIAAFVELAHEVNPIIAALLAGFGALLSDLVIFELLRFSSFGKEIDRLGRTNLITRVHSMIHHETVPEHLRRYALWTMAALVIASPLPDEIGIALLSSTTRISERAFSVLCFGINTLGILAILLLAQAVRG